MDYGDNEQCFKINSPKEKYKTGVEPTRTSIKIRGRIWCHDGLSIFLLTGYTRHVLLVVIGKTEKSADNAVINNGLTISMKNVSQHST